MSETAQGSRKQPPDRPSAGKEGPDLIPSTKEGLGASSSQNLGGTTGVEETANTAARRKMPRTTGAFTGEVSLKPRVEEWMKDHEMEQENQGPKSYKEAVRPNPCYDEEGYEYPYNEDDWDGSLLTSNTEEMKKGVTIFETENGPQISFSEEERLRLGRKWQYSLIIKLLGRNLGYMQLNRKLQAMWGQSGQVDLSFIGNGFMLATFRSKEDYFYALEGGPWLIQNHYLTVQTWKSNFNPWTERIKKLAIWVRLPGLPVEYYDRKFFFNLGNQIGTALKIDEMTLRRARTMFARMCVEIDLESPLIPSYNVDGNSLRIEYEGLHLICFHCGKFGHAIEQCPVKRAQEVDKEKENRGNEAMQVEMIAGENGGQVPQKYGEWMFVQDPRKGRKVSQKATKSGPGQGKMGENTVNKSRFAVLEVEDDNLAVEEGKNEVSDRQVLRDFSNKGESDNARSYRGKGKNVETRGLNKGVEKISRGPNIAESKERKFGGRARGGDKEGEDLKGEGQIRGIGQESAQEGGSKKKRVGLDFSQEMRIEDQQDRVRLGSLSYKSQGNSETEKVDQEETVMNPSIVNLSDQEMEVEIDKPPDPGNGTELMEINDVEKILDNQEDQWEDDELIHQCNGVEGTNTF